MNSATRIGTIARKGSTWCIIGWIGLCLIMTALCFLRNGCFDGLLTGKLCAFREATGLYCPGCGATRACFALAKGQIFRSFLLHPMPVVLLVFYVTGLITFSIRVIGKKVPDRLWFYRRIEILLFTVLGLMIVQWGIKIVFQCVYHRDWFAMIEKMQ
ncbi:MAG: DUF2752 domain-containing protein [Lachnospiraceae bacterium]|nr:DUF2752 domain-containing protein [Lachnospiraceae bacterium]